MNINQAFPSKYLSAGDLQGKEPTVVISHIVNEKVGDDVKPILYFQNKEKGVVLNKTNAMTIAQMYGPETDAWQGQRITLITVWTDFQGKPVQAIRIKPVFPNPQAQVAQQMQAPQGNPHGMQGQAYQGQPHPGIGNPPPAGMDDDIPW